MRKILIAIILLMSAGSVFAYDYYSNGRYADYGNNNYRSNYSYQQQMEQQEQMRRMQQEQANQEYYRRQQEMDNRYRQNNQRMFNY